MWQAVETAPSQYNITYLQEINTLINQIGAAGLYVLIDAHQDVFARRICGEGVPDFYAENLADKCGDFGPIFEDFGGCTPMSKLNLTYDDNGDPLISDCLKHDFPLYYTTPEAASAFERLYKNTNGIQDKFLAYWNTVSVFFANNQYVVGYDPLNEPLAANYDSNPEYAYPGVFDREVLQYLWQNVSKVIRGNDKQKIIFFEPVQSDVIPALGGIIFNVGFNQTPGGPSYNYAQVFNEHTYCCQIDFSMCASNNGDPPATEAHHCAFFHSERLRIRSEDAQRLNVGLMITEFGACSASQDCVNEINAVTNACDSHLVGWAYWMFKGFGDYTTAGSTIEGFYDSNGDLEELKVKALTRTYAQAYQGIPTKLSFNTETNKFVTVYTLSPSVNAPTVIYLNQAMNYPNGYNISIVNSLNLQPVVSTTGNFISILYKNPVISTITITITPKSS